MSGKIRSTPLLGRGHGRERGLSRTPLRTGRVSYACRHCAAARVKCDEIKPCTRCCSRNITCELNPATRSSSTDALHIHLRRNVNSNRGGGGGDHPVMMYSTIRPQHDYTSSATGDAVYKSEMHQLGSDPSMAMTLRSQRVLDFDSSQGPGPYGLAFYSRYPGYPPRPAQQETPSSQSQGATHSRRGSWEVPHISGHQAVSCHSCR
ncbi:hypothetical protein CGCFRS4_v015520 [Colletotrichum fructicola]|nr:hypothetical protein CGCFRS4_v015520 [Colletotrichum fructicola]